MFYGRKRYPDDGLDLYAKVWCHECGADGPHADEFVCSDADVEDLKKTAAALWNRRDNRHRSMYDGGDERGLCEYPRKVP
jgi:hypothetical protein